jgi:hypothetical protein
VAIGYPALYRSVSRAIQPANPHEGPPVRERLTISLSICLAASIPVLAAAMDDGSTGVKQQGTASKETPDQETPAKKSPEGTTAAKKAPAPGKAARKKAVKASAAKKKAAKNTGLDMEPAIVCKSIDGYEDYEPLPGAAQTSEEKLLVYIRPTGYQSEKVEKGYQAHLTIDGEVRKRGEKTILRQKKKLLDYQPVYSTPVYFIYLKHAVSLKGLVPGDYELTIILHDEIAKGATASQVVKFKIIPNVDPGKVEEQPPPNELDGL